MKALKINTEVELAGPDGSGTKVFLKAGSIVVIDEVYYDLKNRSEVDGTLKIPTQIVAPFYESESAYAEKAASAGNVVGYSNTTLTAVIVKFYVTEPAEELAIDVIYEKLNTLFPDQITEINI